MPTAKLMRSLNSIGVVVAPLAILLAGGVASAQQPAGDASASPATTATTAQPSPPPPPVEPKAVPDQSKPVEPKAWPYTLPFALRGMSAVSAVRAETTYGLDTGTSNTVVQYLTASYAPTKHISVFARGGWSAYVPNAGSYGSAFTNVALGGLWGGKVAPNVSVAATIGTGLPSGQGGGNTPDKDEAAAIAAGNLARSRMDGSTMFSPNDIAPFLGGDIAWVYHGLTLQAEATIFQLFRVRGSGVQTDTLKTSLTWGLHAGYFLIPQLSIGVELRDQTFLSTPAAVAAGKAARTYFTFGGGVRVHLKLDDHVWLRPGLAYVQPLNDPTPTMHASSYHIIQLDVPIVF